MDRAVFVYTTFPSLVEAEAAAKVIVERKLAACANTSQAWFRCTDAKGRCGAEEVVAIFKTLSSLADDVRQAVREGHSDEVPRGCL
jgi:periplasmic divalent cation tolerance protein